MVAVIVALIYGGQLWVMKGQLKQMQSSSADTHSFATAAGTLATQTTNLATAAGIQATADSNFAMSVDNINKEIGRAETDFARMAKSSEASIKATQDTMRLDERAWVGAGNIQMDQIKDGATPNVSVSYQNSGKTFALDVVTHAYAYIVSSQILQLPNTPTDAIVDSVSVLAPGMTQKSILQIFAINEVRKIYGPTLPGALYVYVFGQ